MSDDGLYAVRCEGKVDGTWVAVHSICRFDRPYVEQNVLRGLTGITEFRVITINGRVIDEWSNPTPMTPQAWRRLPLEQRLPAGF